MQRTRREMAELSNWRDRQYDGLLLPQSPLQPWSPSSWDDMLQRQFASYKQQSRELARKPLVAAPNSQPLRDVTRRAPGSWVNALNVWRWS